MKEKKIIYYNNENDDVVNVNTKTIKIDENYKDEIPSTKGVL